MPPKKPNATPTPAELLDALAAIESITPTLADLADGLGVPAECLDTPLRTLEVAGLVSRWETCPDGPAVALTPLAAWRAGLKIVRLPPKPGQHVTERWETVAKPPAVQLAKVREAIAVNCHQSPDTWPLKARPN